MEIKKRGRPANIKNIKKAQELLQKGLSYRDVMRAMKKKDTKTIYRWARYVV